MKIIMYHYVKDFSKTEFKNLKGLSIEEFEYQIKFLKKNFDILGPDDVKEILIKKKEIKDKYCWLTFDDGYIDHYENVIPILKKNNLKGSFFPPVISTKQNKILDVNKIQLILQTQASPKVILGEITKYYLDICRDKNEENLKRIIKMININHRFDSSEVIIIKRLLQKILPKKIRVKICDILFKKYIGSEERYAKKFYMSLNQLKEIKKLGHEIGLHGYDHDWYSIFSFEKQLNEINRAVNFWKINNVIDENFTFCYPYGDYNTDTINISKKIGCALALTTKVGSVSKKNINLFELPRFDTNDFPKNS